MTAVEWLVQQIDNGKIEIIYSDKIHSIKCLPEFVKQAIEMEKQQMIDSFIEGHNVCRCVTDNTDEAKECFDEWFKTYKNAVSEQSKQLPICKCENTERIEVGSGSWNIHCKDCGKNW